MRMMHHAATAIKPRQKPPKPPETQTLTCPAGMTGTGIVQTRVCTFNYGLPFQWECTPWVEQSRDCVPIVIEFITPTEDMVPPIGGSTGEGSASQDYGPYTVPNGSYSMTLTFNGYNEVIPGTDPPGYIGYCDLTITITGAQQGDTVSVLWDRDYATFPDMTLDATLTAKWVKRLLSEWTANGTHFDVTLHPLSP